MHTLCSIRQNSRAAQCSWQHCPAVPSSPGACKVVQQVMTTNKGDDDTHSPGPQQEELVPAERKRAERIKSNLARLAELEVGLWHIQMRQPRGTIPEVEEHCMLQIHSHYDSFKQAAASSKAAKCEATKKVKAAKTYPPQPLRRSRRPAAIVAAHLLSSQPAGTPERKSPGSSDNAYEPESGGTGVFCCTSTVCPATPSSP